MMSKTLKICKEALPAIIMIALIPFIQNDYSLMLAYIVVIILAFVVLGRHPKDATVFIFGFLAMIASEYLFVSTGVETFQRHTLFGLMPIWLPFLWAYAFVAIKRSVIILGE
jgi:hypothetical protein